MNILLTGSTGFLGHHLVDKITHEIEEINKQKNYDGEDIYQLFTPPRAEMDCLKYDEVYYY